MVTKYTTNLYIFVLWYMLCVFQKKNNQFFIGIFRGTDMDQKNHTTLPKSEYPCLIDNVLFYI